MKKVFLILLLLCFSLLFCSCGRDDEEISPSKKPYVISEESLTEDALAGDFVGMWITFSELSAKGKSEREYGKYLDFVFSKMKARGVTDAFFHIRPFCDSFYPSKYYPFSEYLFGERGKGGKYDPLKMICERGKKNKIKIHAWLNPYRVGKKDKLLRDETIKRWYDEKSGNVISVGDNLYLNPAREAVRSLIIDGVREILSNYCVDGIHFDDYFYPENSRGLDSSDYDSYNKKGGKLSYEDFRRENVNTLISSVYCTVKSFGEKKIFSVSPSGDIEKNYSEIYADAASWFKGGYCDIIIPQLYYGFLNSSKPFEKTLNDWILLCEGSETKMAVGLALYKEGKEDEFAGSGKEEWIKDEKVIEKQILLLKEKGLFGYCLFSFSYLK